MKHEPINQPIAVPERARVVMAMLNNAAERGEQCPTNAFLAGAIGAGSIATPAAIISLLETMGLITVRRFIRSRVVTIVSTGKSTRRVSGIEIKFMPGRRRTSLPWDTQEVRDTFADELSESGSVTKARVAASLTEWQGREMFRRIASEMGAQAA